MEQNNSQQHLDRGLSFLDAFSVVVGSVIGTGVFLKVATMTQSVGSCGYVMAAWVVAGLLTLSGALVYGEIGALYPHAGGEYVYVREAYGKLWAFLYGWMRLLIASPATLAAYTVGAGIFLSGVANVDGFAMNLPLLGKVPGANIIACILIVIFTVINCFKVSVSGKLQTFLTMIKILLIFGLAVVLFFSGKGEWSHLTAPAATNPGWPGFGAFGAAMMAALWAYDGWNGLPMMAGEIKNPNRNVPLSLIGGMFAVMVLYCLVHLAYFYVLPLGEIVNANSTAFPDALPAATKAVQLIMGSGAVRFMSIMFVISSIGALHGATMSFARVPFAMARDGIFFSFFGKIHEKTHVPVISVVIQGVVSCIFAVCLDFDKLTNYVLFSSWIFYALVAGSIFKFRKIHGVPATGYKTWGYPWIPVVFIIVAAYLLVNTVMDSPKDSGIGLGIIAAGIPFYYMFKVKKI